MYLRSRIKAIAATMAVSVMLLAGCSGAKPAAETKPAAGGSTAAPAAAPAPKGPIKLGLMAATTTDAALIGVEAKNGVTMAVDEFNAAGGVNGQKVEIVFADSAQNDAVAVNAYNKVMSEKPVVLVGTIWSSQDFAIAPLVNEAKIPTIIAGTNPKLTREASKWFFRVRPDDGITASAGTKYVLDQLKLKKVGIIYQDDQFGAGGADVIKKTLKEAGLEPVAVVSHGVNDKDVSSQLLNLQKAGADVIIAWEGPAQIAIILKQRQQLGIKAVLVASPGIAQPATAKLLTDAEMEGAYGIVDAIPAANPDSKVQNWLKKYKETYKADAGPYGAEYYDGAMMLLNAVKKAGTDPEAIMKELKSTKEYKGIANSYTSDKFGNATHSVQIVQFSKKEPKVITTVAVKPEM